MNPAESDLRGVFVLSKRSLVLNSELRVNERNSMSASVDDNASIAHQRVFEELRSREPIFHHPELGTSIEDYERMTAGDFWEVGASGRIYDRRLVIDILQKRYTEPFEDDFRLEGCKCRQLSQDTWLFTYTLHQGDRVSRRATVWQRSSGDWKIVYHQGTLVDLG